MEKYRKLGLEMGLSHVVPLGPEQVFFDPRARLKCRWGCEEQNRYGLVLIN